MELTILMPCLNEAETLETCVAKARGWLEANGVDGEVIVADNGSTDGSQQLAQKAGARIVPVPIRGYGAALLAGIQAAQGRYVIMPTRTTATTLRGLVPLSKSCARATTWSWAIAFAVESRRGPCRHCIVTSEIRC
jgi:hypothetical protein